MASLFHRFGDAGTLRNSSHSSVQQQQQQPHKKPKRLRILLAALFAVVGNVILFRPMRLFFTTARYNSAMPPTSLANGRPIFGPSRKKKHDDSFMTTYSATEQRSFLKRYGWTCQQSLVSHSPTNFLLERFDVLPEAYATELWKYCVLYVTPGVYWDTSMAWPLQLPSDILGFDTTTDVSLAIALDDDTAGTEFFGRHQPPLHHSFLAIHEPRSMVALGMMRFLLEAETLHPSSLHQTLALLVATEAYRKHAVWKAFHAVCLDTVSTNGNENSAPSIVHHQIDSRRGNDSASFHQGEPCSATHGEPCCHVWAADTEGDLPVMSLFHSKLMAFPPNAFSVDNYSLPFFFENIKNLSKMPDSALGMPAADLPYISTIREFKTNAPIATMTETPNFFDLLLNSDCFSDDKECFKCLRLDHRDLDHSGDCQVCKTQCPCYCKSLCQVRPPPKRLAAKWEVTPPRYKVDPSRLIPRVIHQTWFESVNKEAYPNLSHLIESFRQSGWEYEFYDDTRAAQFLSTHFPPQVREAYDAIVPGVFKADLFRYCVLLIRGGVYADVDIMLQSNLDQAVDASVGFMVAQDSPGDTVGHRSCLWNGFMASAPGHVFLAQTIQNVINNVRNRFTSIDYDDMLCPNPVLSVSHAVDTLFTSGSCILGASLNDVLKRHRQTGFVFGDIDVFETERKLRSTTSKRMAMSIDPDDPRLLIPGRSVLLRQNKNDMGSHRFTNAAANLIVATTDMPGYDDRPKSMEEVNMLHAHFDVYGRTDLYRDSERANEEVIIRVKTRTN